MVNSAGDKSAMERRERGAKGDVAGKAEECSRRCPRRQRRKAVGGRITAVGTGGFQGTSNLTMARLYGPSIDLSNFL